MYKHRQDGFTIVELLIVIVVIGVLAAITIVAYNGIQNRSYDSAVQNDLAAVKKKLEILKIDTGTYTGDPAMQFKATKSAYAITPITSHNFTICYYAPNYDQFKVIALSKSGNRYLVSNTSGVAAISGPWLAAQDAMCESQGAPTGGNNLRGYAADDTVTGPWRSWVGGN